MSINGYLARGTRCSRTTSVDFGSYSSIVRDWATARAGARSNSMKGTHALMPNESMGEFLIRMVIMCLRLEAGNKRQPLTAGPKRGVPTAYCLLLTAYCLRLVIFYFLRWLEREDYKIT